jgi:16S rRNA (guanine(966)-N(2))-methyltransferase RsmD
MRIIAGQFKGRTLQGPSAHGVRPTSDRLRETLFNLVDVETPGCRVLDGFAGTGAVGLEALSRGATHVTFVERDPRAVAVIERNVKACGAEDRCIIVRGDFTGAVRRLAGDPRFDLVLLDPPYDFPDTDAALAGAAALLRPGGLIVLEHARRREPPAGGPALAVRRQVTAGDSQLTFYARAGLDVPAVPAD